MLYEVITCLHHLARAAIENALGRCITAQEGQGKAAVGERAPRELQRVHGQRDAPLESYNFV